MHYFFKKHEKNFNEWRRSGYQGVSEIGVDFLKHIGSKHFKPNLKLWNEKQWQKVQLEKLGWKYKMITKGRAAFYNKI